MAEADEDSSLALDNQLCFALYAASRAMTSLYRELLGDVELTYPQYLVMLVLWERGTLTVKELSRALHLDSGTLSPLLRRLEGAGLLTRQRSAADERVVEVSLTASGGELRARAREVPDRVLCAADLSRERAQELRDLLGQITRSVEATARGHPSC